MTLRCFVASFLDRPSADLLAAAARQALAQLGPGARALRAVAPENYHVTLRFLGAQPAAAVAPLQALVGSLQGHPVTAQVLTIGGFPRARRALVQAAELAAQPQLQAWAVALGEQLGPGDRPFRAHITLARARRPLYLPPLVLDEPLAVTLAAPLLYRSDTRRDGAVYQALLPGDTLS
ncbi:MAG: RNA 2',3'-cyclic phosphodiesterase [Pseudomonadales bacterium]